MCERLSQEKYGSPHRSPPPIIFSHLTTRWGGEILVLIGDHEDRADVG